MDWTIPGSQITVGEGEIPYIPEKIKSMFLGGGMVLSQVAAVTGLEPYTVQNWVKRGFLTPPVQKKYSLRQLCRILNIHMLKSALPLEEICNLLQYVNGNLSDESDDLIDDTQLYFLFLRVAMHHRQMGNPAGRDAYLDTVLSDYVEPVPGARERVKNVLQIMLTAWASAQLQQTAKTMINELRRNENGTQ